VSTPIVCIHCRKPCTSRFEITRFDTAGTNKGTVAACSVICLVQWAYQYSQLQGARLAYGAKSAFDNFMAAMKGLGSKS
jgi:hypothetical protein